MEHPSVVEKVLKKALKAETDLLNNPIFRGVETYPTEVMILTHEVFSLRLKVIEANLAMIKQRRVFGARKHTS